MLSVEEILKANDTTVQTVPCPEWGGEVYVGTLTAEERDSIEQAVQQGVPSRAAIVAESLRTEDGQKVKVSPSERLALSAKATAPIERIVDAVLKLNKMNAEQMEVTEKN